MQVSETLEELKSRNFHAYADAWSRQKSLKTELFTKGFFCLTKFFKLSTISAMLKICIHYL